MEGAPSGVLSTSVWIVLNYPETANQSENPLTITIMNFDPLLGEQPTYNIPQLEEEQKKLSERLEQLKRGRVSTVQQPHAPVWDEIDSIVAGMSDQELDMMNSNEEYQESSATVQAILQREYLRIMRPIVEATKDGKDALDRHLTLIKRLRKSAREAVNRKYSLMDEYLERYSNMPFDEFMKMKREQKGGRNDTV